MKKILSFVVVLISVISVIYAQPQKMTYQAVVRDNNNQLIVNTQVGLQVTIVEDIPNGPIIYRETHLSTTNANGLVSIVIGTGVHPYTISLSDVKWGQHDHYFTVDVDPAGGTNYTITGTQQLMTVPYSFYSGSAGLAVKADTSLYALNANVANTAVHSDTALYLVHAPNSDTALYSINSDTALYSFHSDTSTYSNNSANSVSAIYSDTALYSFHSDTSNY